MSSVFLSHSQISRLSVYDFRLGNELLESKCSACICYLFLSKKFPQNLMFKTTINIFHLTDLTTSAVQGFRSGLVGWLRLEYFMKQSRCQAGLQSPEGLTEAEKSTCQMANLSDQQISISYWQKASVILYLDLFIWLLGHPYNMVSAFLQSSHSGSKNKTTISFMTQP